MRLAGIFIVLLLAVQGASANPEMTATASPLEVDCASFASRVELTFDVAPLAGLDLNPAAIDSAQLLIPEEGTTYELNRPMLPAVSRFVVVPPDAGIALEIEDLAPRIIQATTPPLLCTDPEIDASTISNDAIYPAVVAEMSQPMIIRGVRLVKVTVYPVQYNSTSGEYLIRDHIQANLKFTSENPVNPVVNPVRRHRSREFLKFIEALAVNGDEVGRDDPDDAPDYLGYYLVVTNQDALLWNMPFIEWRRKAGYKVDILSLTDNNAGNAATVKQQIQTRYNTLVNAGEDPFDQILLIGDRLRYDRHVPAAQNVLAAETGVTTFGQGAPHADYKYALLEGNDEYPDVGYSRFLSGSAPPAALAVGRTLAYEMTPRMQNTRWFTKAMVYSQHWGNNQNSAWNITIATNVRWGEALLRRLNYQDISVYEDLNWDQNGDRIGPAMRAVLNAGCNLMIGRAENYYWRSDFNGVNINTVFPINICVSGHGESAGWNMFRTGNANSLKGPVASTFVWGDPATAPSNYTWLQLVNSLLCDDMTLGWSRVAANVGLEKIFPNVNVDRQALYSFSKTDLDCNGDPGIQPWTGVPRQLVAEAPDTILINTHRIDVHVYDNEQNADAAGVNVSLYAPGAIPLDNAANYARWVNILAQTTVTDEDGMAHFVLTDDQQFVENTTVYLTVTGRDVVPVMKSAHVVTNRLKAIELAGWNLTQISGNDDDAVNPGESFALTLTASNPWNGAPIPDVFGEVTSNSPYVSVDNNQISFGEIDTSGNAEGDRSVEIHVHPSAPDAVARPGLIPELFVKFTSNDDEWVSAFKLPILAPRYQLRQILPNDTITTEIADIDFDISNVGVIDGVPLIARLVSPDNSITLLRDQAEYLAIRAENHRRIDGEKFSIAGSLNTIPGSRCKLLLILTAADSSGFVDTVTFTLKVGVPRVDAPLGPDRAGYACYDDSDVNWDNVPTYDWFEINPVDNEADAEGNRINFAGNSQENMGEAEIFPLAFETQFYGEVFDTIIINLNGFIAMGYQPRIVNGENWPLDQGFGGGVGMIAPLWDDLRLGQGSGVFTYYDEPLGRVIIEWYRMRNVAANVEFTFQVILYDQNVWPTNSGDQPILFQYKTFTANANVRNGETAWVSNIPYASVGISSPDGTTGISYCFNNVYPTAAARLGARRALLFTHPNSVNSLSLNLRSGWNTVSLNIQLEDSSITSVMQPLLDAGLVNYIKDGVGRFFRASDGFNQIPYWDIENGYQISVSRDANLTLVGDLIPSNQPIHLEQGWNLKSYLPRWNMTVTEATASIADELVIVKDGYGSFYLPRFEYSNLSSLSQGHGYFFNVSAETDLIYAQERDRVDSAPVAEIPSTKHFIVAPGQPGSDMSLLLFGVPELTGQEVGVYLNNRLVGAGVFDDAGRCGLAVWGESFAGSVLEFQIWSGVNQHPINVNWIVGDGEFASGKVSVGSISTQSSVVPSIPATLTLESISPNPFNSRANVRFGLSKAGRASLVLYNLTGQKALTLAEGRFESGWHSATLDADLLPTGVYWVRLEAEGTTSTVKAVIVR